MSSIRAVSLLSFENWDIRQFNTPSEEVATWPSDRELANLSESAARMRPNGYSLERVNCVSPNEVDSRSGEIVLTNKYFSQLYFDWKLNDIQNGDLILHKSGAVFINDSIEKALISEDFILLRPHSKEQGLLLWAIFNSSVGRSHLLAQSKRIEFSTFYKVAKFSDIDIKQFAIPIIQLPEHKRVLIKKLIEGVTHKIGVGIETFYSWSKKANLADAEDWYRAATSRSEIDSLEGIALRGFLQEIKMGRAPKKNGLEITGRFLPLITSRYVTHRRNTDLKLVATGENLNVLTQKGDLLITTNGRRSLYYLNEFEAILGPNVIAVSPREGTSSEKMLSIFASPSVQEQISYLLSRGIIGHLSASNVGALIVPLELESHAVRPSSFDPLSAKLDSILWS